MAHDKTALSDWFFSGFDQSVASPRTVGREAEFPVVRKSGELFEVILVMAELADRVKDSPHNGEPIVDEYDGQQVICGVRSDRWACFVEGGTGTVEITVGPAGSLGELSDLFEPIVNELIAVLDGHDAVLLGYGTQPVTPPERKTLVPRSRYATMLSVLGESEFLPWSVTAGDQTHVSIGLDELVTVVNALHAATPLVIALTANSRVMGGSPTPWASTREHLMGQTGAQTGRHGIPPRMLERPHDYVDFLLEQPVLFRRDSTGTPVAYGKESLRSLLNRDPGTDAKTLLTDQDHYTWANARPRRQYSTVEYRPACQQPRSASWVPSALTVGIVERAEDVLQHVLAHFGSWDEVRAARQRAVVSGMDALVGQERFVRTFLDIVWGGLEARAMGESDLLSDAYGWIDRGENEASRSADVFTRGGAAEFVKQYSYKSPASIDSSPPAHP